MPTASGQMHKVEQPEAVVRAVGVYEWTGDLQKPQASRLIPVTVFINGELQDGSIYEPRPIPFALLPGNEYVLQQAGIDTGLLELRSASKAAGADEGDVDGWWGYGTFHSEREVKAARLRVLKDESKVSGSNDAADDKKSKGDPDRPTLRRRSNSGAKSDGKSPDATKPGSGTDDASVPADDPDRPVLKRHGSAEASSDANPPSKAPQGQAPDADVASEVSSESLNRDPGRPVLHRGRPADGGGVADTADSAVGGKLTSRSSDVTDHKDVHQMVAVSDAKNRPEHDFKRAWTDEAEHKAVLQEMQAIAQAKLAAYVVPGTTTSDGSSGGTSSRTASGTNPSGVAPQKSGTTPSSKSGQRATAQRRTATAKKPSVATPAVPLSDEELRSYLLSYGGAPTYTYTGHTAGVGDALRYVTVVAQQDVYGKLQVAFSSVTDAAHLDRVAAMRLVGVVDAEASNRASLLFEMREQAGRQFALFQVVGARSDQLFVTGLTP